MASNIAYSNLAPVTTGASALYDEVPPPTINQLNGKYFAGSVVEEERPYCRALYDFRGENNDELSFSAGDIIYLTRKVNNEWLEGEAQRNGQKGIFPCGFVEIVEGLSDDTVAEHGGKPSMELGLATVLHAFDARYNDELTVQVGDSVRVVQILDDNWAQCYDASSDKSGILPLSYLQLFLEGEEQAPPLGTPTTRPPSTPHKEQATPWSCEVYKWEDSNKRDGSAANSIPTSQEHPPLPSIQPFNVFDMDFLTDMMSGKSAAVNRAPPPRPPPPSSTNNAEPLTSANQSSGPLLFGGGAGGAGGGGTLRLRVPPGKVTDAKSLSSQTSSFTAATATTAKREVAEQKEKIIQDLLATEIAYLNDLNLWETQVNAASLDDETKSILTSGYPLLKALSQKLIDNILAQKDRPEERRHYGEMLMEMREQFFRTYAHHCRCAEQANQIVEGADTALMEELGQCLLKMRSQGSNLFDVPSAVSRPIHRCLKYPLYVGELLKNTPINHPDHPKLLESLKQLGNLALKMNECKRRKELIKKYREEQQLSLRQRFQRINMHSLVKKSNRLKYRITSNFGMGTVRDSEFDYLIAQLDAAERRLCKFLYAAQIYKKNLESAFKRHEESYKYVCQSQQEEASVKAFASMFRQVDKIYRNYIRFYEENVISEGKKLVRCEYTKLIHKRCDKLADYETAKTKNIEDVEMRRNEYEALNNQVKNNLPRVISSINKKVVQLVEKTHELDEKFLTRMDEWFAKERPQKIKDLLPYAKDFRHFLSLSQKERFLELDRTLKVHTEQSIEERLAAVGLGGLPKKSKTEKTNGEAVRPQSTKERDALIKTMKAQGRTSSLRRVTKEIKKDGFFVKVGDVVIVLDYKYGSCLCDNGVAKAELLLDQLASLDENYSFYSLPIGASADGSADAPVAERTREKTKQKEAATKTQSLKLGTTTSSSTGKISQLASEKAKTGRDKNECFDLIDLSGSSPEKKTPAQSLFPSSTLFDRSPDDEILSMRLIDYDSEPRAARISADRFSLSELPQHDSNGERAIGAVGQNPLADWPAVPLRADQLPLQQLLMSPSQQPRCASVPLGRDPFGDLFHSSLGTKLASVVRDSPAPEIPTRPEGGLTGQQGVESLNSLHGDGGETPIIIPAIPQRTAPLPPLPKSMVNLDVTSFTAPTQQNIQPASEPLGSAPSPRGATNLLHICSYDFTPADTADMNQLAIREGDRLEVLQKHDDAGNGEWWLVKRIGEEKSGYVPANYLHAYLPGPTTT